MKHTFYFFLSLLSLTAFGQNSPDNDLKYFAALFSRGSRWDTTKTPIQQPHFAEHGALLKRLRNEGKITLGGRFGEFGLVVFTSRSEEEIRLLFTGDSLVQKDILQMKLYPFTPFYNGCIGE